MATPCCSSTMIRSLILLGIATAIQAVDKGNFKTCSQSSFCQRNRNLQSGQSSYIAQLNTLLASETRLSFNILDTKTNVVLTSTVFALEDRTLRLKISELNPIRPRYEVKDSLVGQPKEQTLRVTSKSDERLVAEFGDSNKLVITSAPFRLDLYLGDTLVISTNPRGLLNVEHYRQKKYQRLDIDKEQAEEKEAEDEAAEKKEDVVAEEDPDEEGMWEETFKSHQDTKPHGPSSVGVDFSFLDFKHVYGIPEHAESFALKTTKSGDPYRLYNLDVFEYELYNPMALYGAVPYMLAHNERNSVGVFWNNAAETWVDISSDAVDKNIVGKLLQYVKGDDEMPQMDVHFFSESGIVDVFFMMGPKPADLFRQYSILTGTTPLPPLFALGNHQSRWNYNDEEDVAKVDAGFDEHDMPMDVIWLDIEHTDGKRYFTWDTNKFPHPEDMLRNLSAKGRKMVTIVDPHLKQDQNYAIYKEAHDQGLLVKDRNSNDFQGWCWPGNSMWPDFLSEKVQQWWASKFEPASYRASLPNLFVWNDMNEPSVFNGPEITMHKDARHDGGWEHRDVHNLYGMLVQKATAEGLRLRSGGNDRPFVLSRAFFAGSQRFGAVWTGDNLADWGHLKVTTPMFLSISVTGIPFVGADVGGFFRNVDGELLTRWYQAGAFHPFLRTHAHLDTRRREPWLFTPEEAQRMRQALRQRYALLQYWYTLFYEHEKTGLPVMRPMWAEFPEDEQVFAMDDQFMVGSALLVRPVVDSGAKGVNVYFAGGDDNVIWYDYDTYQARQSDNKAVYINVDLDRIPVYQKGGTIIAKKDRIRRAAMLALQDPYTLIVALDSHQKAEGTLYMDDGFSFQYQKGAFNYRRIEFDGMELKSTMIDGDADYSTKSWLERVVIMGLQKKPRSILANSQREKNVKLSSSYLNKGDTPILVIRKPDVNMAEDWTVTLTF